MKHNTNEELKVDGNFLAQMARSASVGFLLVSKTGIIEFANAVAKHMSGLKLGDRMPEFDLSESAWKTRLEARGRHLEGICQPLKDDDSGAVAVWLWDVSCYVETQTRLNELSMTDELTGLRNRRGFFEEAEIAITSLGLRSDMAAVFVVDIDGLKQINDLHGHVCGDSVIRTVARCLQRSVRRSDVVGRIGGDEFCILAPITAKGQAQAIRERVMRQLELQDQISEMDIRLSVSIGVSIESIQTLRSNGILPAVAIADQMMYLEKACRRGFTA